MVSETLLKYLGGLLDADGCLNFNFTADRNNPDCFTIQLKMVLSSSDAVDRNGFVETLPSLTGMGYVFRTGGEKQFITWQVAKAAQLEMLLPRLTKHMVVKAKHWKWLYDVWREHKGRRRGKHGVSSATVQTLKQASKDSRQNTGPIKPKNHPSWAWLAGYLDGDGCYQFTRVHPKKPGQLGSYGMGVTAVAHHNDAAVLYFLQKAFGGVVRDHNQSPMVKVWYRSLALAHKSFALRFLPHLAKHSMLKRYKIEQLIHRHTAHVTLYGPNAALRQQRLSEPTPAGEATV